MVFSSRRRIHTLAQATKLLSEHERGVDPSGFRALAIDFVSVHLNMTDAFFSAVLICQPYLSLPQLVGTL